PRRRSCSPPASVSATSRDGWGIRSHRRRSTSTAPGCRSPTGAPPKSSPSSSNRGRRGKGRGLPPASQGLRGAFALAPGGLLASFSDSRKVFLDGQPIAYEVVEFVAEAVSEDGVVDGLAAPISLR